MCDTQADISPLLTALTRVAGGGGASPSGRREGGVQIYVTLNYKNTD